MGINKPEGRIFLIADTHFGDENIRLYEERPFPDTDTMDREIIKRWNSVIGDNDFVYHLGDFCSGTESRCRELLSQLKGHKRLVIGNHDTRLTPQQWRDLGFEECYDQSAAACPTPTFMDISTTIPPIKQSAAAAPASVWKGSITPRCPLTWSDPGCLRRKKKKRRGEKIYTL